MKKRILALFLCVSMLAGMVPVDAVAASTNPLPMESELSEEEIFEEELLEEELPQENMSAEAVAELFRRLPSASAVTEETTEEEKAALMAQLEKAVSAYDALLENNPEEAAVFEENHAQLYLSAMELNDALTGNDSIEYASYDHDYNSSSSRNITITVNNENRSAVTGATVTVTDSYGDTYEVREVGNGQYKFTRSYGNFLQYTITVSHADYETKTTRINGGTTSTTITLEEKQTSGGDDDVWENFNVFYIATGEFPSSYSSGLSISSYGPSGNNTPLVTIRVNVTQLMKEHSDVVRYEARNGNWWHYIPTGGAPNMAAAKAFWEAVKACMDEDSIEKFEATGLYDSVVLFVLKKQYDNSQHADGVLEVKDTSYVLEFSYNGEYFGGAATDSDDAFTTMEDVKAAYTAHLRDLGAKTVTWNDLSLSGVYQTDDNIYTITVSQTNLRDAVEVAEDSDFPYKKVSSNYYLATFDCTIEEGAEGFHTVTYTDGVTGADLFPDQTYVVETGKAVPAFSGDPKEKYEGYTFDGWALAGGSGELLSAEQIANMTVTGDMVFQAQWSRIPTAFEATVNVVLNNSQAVDMDTMLGKSNVKLYVSADGTNFHALTRTDVGVYKADLPNGSYYTYYSLDDGATYTKIDGNTFVIASTAGRRNVNYYSVSYELNGGAFTSTVSEEYYHHAGTGVSVISAVPKKADHIFMGWKSNQDIAYDSEELITSYITAPYTLTAQWQKAVDVKVTVVIKHGNDTTATNDKVDFSLVKRQNETSSLTGLSKSLSKEKESHEGFDYTYTENGGSGTTTYTPKSVTFEDLPDADYSLNCFKGGYETAITKTVKDGVQHITLTLTYNPARFALDFDVVMDLDPNAPKNTALWPQAVLVKAVRWGEQHTWELIPENQTTSVRVNIDKTTGKGSGQVSVPRYWPNNVGDGTEEVYYRVIVTDYIMPNGKTVSAQLDQNAQNETYVSTNGTYEGVVSIEGKDEDKGGLPGYPSGATLHGSFYKPNPDADGQSGIPTVTVSLNAYDVTFEANTVAGGMVEGEDSHKVAQQITIPAYAGFTMTPPAEGYLFEGWYSQDGTKHSGDWGERIVAGTEITQNTTVYAKWKEPITIEGDVFVAGSYIGEDDAPISIHAYDRIQSVIVVLRKDGVDGNVKSTPVSVTYTGDLGKGAYCFTNVPDDGSSYYIEVRAVNYSGFFQNEPESIEDRYINQYNLYTKDDNDAVLGENAPKTATVNTYLKFEPKSFNLNYEVDATAISADFRPEITEVLVTYKDGTIEDDPSQWAVISQMVRGGDKVALTDGLGSGNTSVWNMHAGNSALYEYGLRIGTVEGLGNKTGSGLPYHVEYQAPAFYERGSQSKPLKATLIPNEYPIHYEMGIDDTAYTGMEAAPKKHTWGVETNVDVIPVRRGYEFKGWYKNADFTGEKVTEIDAEVSEATTLYAKWIQVQDKVDLTVTIIHQEESGTGNASNYDKDLQVQLTHSLKGSGDLYKNVNGKTQSYDGTHWHVHEDGVTEEIFEVKNIFANLSSEYVYSLNASLEGYVETSKVVTPVVDPDTKITTYDVQITLQYVPDLLQLTVNAEIAKGIDEALWPVSAEVKVNCWYDYPDTPDTIGLGWNTITQHDNTTLTISFDQDGKGSVSYPVWQWFDKEHKTPYYYRMEVVSLRLKDGTVVNMSSDDHVRYVGGNYLADIETDALCVKPNEPVTGTAATTLCGAYGTINGEAYDQTGTVTAIISTDIWDDETPDHMQAEIRFRSADEDMGTLDEGELSQIFTLDKNGSDYKKSVTPSSVTPKAKTGYKFSHWTDKDGRRVDNPFVEQEILGGSTYTYTAHWTVVDGLKLTVKHVDIDDKTVKVHKDTVVENLSFKDTPDLDILVAENIEGYEYAERDKASITIDVGTNEVTMYYRKLSYSYRVEHYFDEVLETSLTDNDSAIYGTVIDDYVSKVNAKPNYTLDYVEGQPLTVGTNAAANVIRVYYAADLNHNNIPDKYEAVVTFKVTDGKWTSYDETTLDHANDITATYPLYEKDGSGNWVKISKVTLDKLPKGEANPGFSTASGKWNIDINKDTEVVGNAVYTLGFNLSKHTISATVENGSASVGADAFSEVTVTNHDTETTTIQFKPNAGYVLDQVLIDGVKGQLNGDSYTFNHLSDHHIHVSYAEDKVGGSDGGGDQIADKYQKKVTFVVVNGTWGEQGGTEIVDYLELKNADEEYDVNGTAELTPSIPTNMTPATGYVAPGQWDKELKSKVSGVHEETYTYKYTDKEQITIIIEVEGGTSLPVPSVTEHDYSATDHDIVFQPKTGYVADSAKIKEGNLSTAAEQDITTGFFDADGKATYTHNHTTHQHIKVVYAKDENGDKTADYKQVFIQFDSAPNGSVSGDVKQVYLAENYINARLTPTAVEKTPDAGYRFSHWTDRDGNTLADPIANLMVEGGETYTFTAHWKPIDDLEYTIRYVDEDGNEFVEERETVKNVRYGKTVTVQEVKKKIDGYTFIRADKDQLVVVSENKDDNVMTLVYGVDRWKDDTTGENDSEEGGDGILDCYQVKVNYHALPEGFGTVTKAYEILTIIDDAGRLATQGQVEISGTQATAKAADASGSYQFVNWTDGVENAALRATIQEISKEALLQPMFIEVTGGSEHHYYANFRYVKASQDDKDNSDDDHSGNTSGSTSQSSTVTLVSGAKTGDASDLGMWLGILAASCLGLLGTIVGQKKKRKNTDA